MSTIRVSGDTSGYFDLTVPSAAGTNTIDLSKRGNLWVIDGEGTRKFDVIDVSYKYKGVCNSLTKEEYLKASK